MLKDALKARIPMIRVTTDDPVNTEAVLQSVAQTKHIAHLDTLTATVLFKADHLLWTDNPKLLTPENYDLLDRKEKCLVFVNTDPHTLLFEAGPLLPTAQQVQGLVSQYTDTDLSQYLQGMDLKAVDHTLRLTSVKFGNLLPSSIRSMRAMLGVPIQGLYPVDTKPEFYQPHESLVEWMTPNVQYFLAPKVSAGLRPRGLLLEGLPGTGKSAASRWVARTLGVPLYRLDIATSMNKYIGESELRLMRILRQLEDYAPCVVLLDEVEKVFVTDSDNGVAQRMMGQLLWWLSEHRSQVLTVMTTNDKSKIPPELFREGRVDQTLVIPPMTGSQALQLSQAYLKLLLGDKLTLKQVTCVAFSKDGQFTPVEVLQLVARTIKANGWGLP